MKYKLQLPWQVSKILRESFNDSSSRADKTDLKSINIVFKGSDYCIEKSLLDENIIIDDDKFYLYKGIPKEWFIEVENNFDLNDVNFKGKPFLAMLVKNSCSYIFIHKFEPSRYNIKDVKFGISVDESAFKISSAESINAAIKTYMKDGYKLKYVSTSEAGVYTYIQKLIIFAYTKDALNSENGGTNIDNTDIRMYKENEFDHYVRNKSPNVLIKKISEDYGIDLSAFLKEADIVIDNNHIDVKESDVKQELNPEPEKKVKQKPTLDPKIEQLTSMTDSTVEAESKVSVEAETVQINHFFEGSFVADKVRNYERLLVSDKGAYDEQKIPFKGISIHHGLSLKSIRNGLCKAPSNISFLKFRCQGFKGARFPTKDFEFSTAGLVSAMHYREAQLIMISNNVAKDNRLLNKHIFNLICMIGSERFCTLYNIAPKLNYMKIAQSVTKRFFGKDLKLTELRANRVKNLFNGDPSISDVKKDNIFKSVPDIFKIFIMTSWNYDDKPDDKFHVVDSTSQSIIDQYGLDQKIIGHALCFYNDRPIYHSFNKTEIKKMTNEIIKYLNHLTDIKEDNGK